jgi:hypothetical protein
MLDIWKLVVEIRDRLEEVEREQNLHVTAFSVNDLNTPDYDGHRKSHAKLTKSEEILDGYKQSATKNVISIVVTFLLGLLAAGFISKISEVLK